MLEVLWQPDRLWSAMPLLRNVQVLASRSRRSARLLLAAILVLSVAVSTASPLRPWERRLELGVDGSFANASSVLLWLLATVLAGRLAKRGKARLGWLSVGALTLTIAIGEVHDIKDMLSSIFFSSPHPSAWMLAVAPIALPLLILAARTLWLESRYPTERALLIVAGLFAAVPLVLDSIPVPIGIAEEGSEHMAVAVLVAVLMSILGWVPLSPTFVTWRFVVIVVVFTVLVAGILDAREYQVRVAGMSRDRPEFHHGPLTLVSQTLRVDRAHLSRIDIFAESSGGNADLFLRLGPPGLPPVRESRATTNHPRWSNQAVTFAFTPIPDSKGQTYEISIGALQPTPFVFIGLSTNDPIPESSVLINGIGDSRSNDLALRAYTPGRGLVWLIATMQYRDRTDVLIGIEIFTVWLWFVVVILWLTTSGFKVSKSDNKNDSTARI